MANTYTLLRKFSGNGSSAAITMSGIPQTYTDLVIRGTGKDTSTTLPSVAFTINFNGDTGNYYTYRKLYMAHLTQSVQVADNSSAFQGGYISTSKTSGADVTGPVEITFPEYTNSSGKLFYAVSSGETPDTTNALVVSYSGGRYSQTSAITSITLTTAGTAWSSTSRFNLYGILKTP